MSLTKSAEGWSGVVSRHPLVTGLILVAMLPILPVSLVLLAFLVAGVLLNKFLKPVSDTQPQAEEIREGNTLNCSQPCELPTKPNLAQELVADGRGQSQASPQLLPVYQTPATDPVLSSKPCQQDEGGKPKGASSPLGSPVGLEEGRPIDEPAAAGVTAPAHSNPADTTSRGVTGAAQGQTKGTSTQPILAAQSAQPLGSTQDKPTKVEATGSAAILARLRQQRAGSKGQGTTKKADAAATGAQKEAIIAYASQTGTAQEIARTIQAEAISHGVKAKVMSCNELGFESLAEAAAKGSEPVVVFVASSTGDGDSPDNAAKFYATLKRKAQPAGIMKGVCFTVLGLGDSNYTRFCAVPRAIVKRLLDLGGISFYASKDADEVDGIEATVDPWVAGLWGPLRQTLSPAATDDAGGDKEPARSAPAYAGAADGLVGMAPLPACRVDLVWEQDAGRCASVAAAEANRPSAQELERRDPEGMYSAEEPFWAALDSARYLTASDSDRVVIHMEFSIARSGIQYLPGDSIGVLPCNDPALVDALLARLGEDGKRVFSVAPAGASGASSEPGTNPRLLPHLHWPCSLRHALLTGCDLTSVPRKSLLRLLAEHCSESGDKQALLNLSSRGGKQAYDAEVKEGRPSLLDLLQRYPSAQPPLAALLDALPPLMPRMYSITSSPLLFSDAVHVAFSVVRYTTASGERRGVATSWLEQYARQLAEGQVAAEATSPRVPVFLRRGGAFGLPASLSAPLLMIGPGTGVAPFRGFLQHRRHQMQEKPAQASGPALLFFGCRRRDEDYLYGDELEAFAADGTLSKLDVAFSRAQAEKVYVQHLLAKQRKDLVGILLDATTHVYVCGDGAAMAKAVHACLASILEEQGGLSGEEALQKLAGMTKEGRYVRDIWS